MNVDYIKKQGVIKALREEAMTKLEVAKDGITYIKYYDVICYLKEAIALVEELKKLSEEK